MNNKKIILNNKKILIIFVKMSDNKIRTQGKVKLKIRRNPQ